MPLFDSEQVKEILSKSEIGLWRVEFEEGKPPRFFADHVMDELLGIDEQVTPEERFVFHHKYIHPDDKEMFEDYSNKLAAERTEVIYRYVHPKKGEMFVRCAGARNYETEEFLDFYGTHQNISDTIRFEKDKYAETRLAEAVAEKEKALKKAKRANAAKSEFLSRMSHDIRTPLNGIIGIMEINEAHSEDIELVAENRRKAKIAAHHLLALINDVLDMSKLEDDSVELIREPVNLTDICNDALTICEIKANENGIALHRTEGMRIEYPNVYGSELHLRQIVMNILNNSVKYNKPGGDIYCDVQLISKDDSNVTYKFVISDTGIGMSEKFIKHIFEPFTQERNDARSRYQGTGMGMAIVKKLVDKMNGTIEVFSKEGEGSSFEITIPFEINKNADDNSCSKKDYVKEIDGMRILLVEDNELNMEIAECILEDAGAIVSTAENGQVAYEKFVNHPAGTYDVILMDIMMPVLDGYAAAKKIRNANTADAGTVPIIAMTANAFAEDVQKAKAAGMNEHISKPIQLDVLLGTLSNFKHLSS